MMRFNDSHPSIHRKPFTDDLSCPHNKDWIYLVTFRLLDRKILGSTQVLAEELQQTLYDEGCMSGGFHVAHIERDVAWVVFDREGCEVDYHECYEPDHGHDGSTEDAIAQVVGELKDALSVANDPLVVFDRVHDRAHYTNNMGSPGFWAMCSRTPDWPDYLLTA